jgi:hypothetical protein
LIGGVFGHTQAIHLAVELGAEGLEQVGRYRRRFKAIENRGLENIRADIERVGLIFS